MKASKFSEAQIAFVLKQAEDGTPVAEVCRKAGISDATFYNWRKKYAGLMPSEMKRLRQLEQENNKLSHDSTFAASMSWRYWKGFAMKWGFPATIRVDQGTEFVSRDLDLWAYPRGVTLDFSRPGKPTDNSFTESFNGKFRSGCLNTHWFLSLDDARQKMEDLA